MSFRYNQAVRVSDTIQISGQGMLFTFPLAMKLGKDFELPTETRPPGPWNRSTFEISADHATQIPQACSNVKFVLRDAGEKG